MTKTTDDIPVVKLDKSDIKEIKTKYPGAVDSPVNPKEDLEEFDKKQPYLYTLNFSESTFFSAISACFAYLFQPVIVPILILVSFFTKKPAQAFKLITEDSLIKRKQLVNNVRVQTKDEYLAENSSKLNTKK